MIDVIIKKNSYKEIYILCKVYYFEKMKMKSTYFIDKRNKTKEYEQK